MTEHKYECKKCNILMPCMLTISVTRGNIINPTACPFNKNIEARWKMVEVEP